MRLFILIVLVVFIYCVWKFFLKNKINFVFEHKQFDLKKLIKPVKKSNKIEPIILPEVIEDDIRRFDDVSKLFFEKAIQKKELNGAEQIQFEFLNKMPTQTQSQIQHFDLGEWSIFWGYKAQSLEYYVSRYGVFYTHVDAQGIEHKLELLDAASYV